MSRKLLHTPEGVRDIYGVELKNKKDIEQKVANTIKVYGYEEVETPSLEYFDVFSKEVGTTPSKELYKMYDNEGNTIVLRPDFTPSIARCGAKYHMDNVHPVRFFYQGNTFTNVSNLQGKLKEVTQMGAELLNDNSVEADAEIISLAIEAVKATGIQNFQVSVGQVEFFKGLCEEAGLDTDTEMELRDYISGKNYFATKDLLDRVAVPEPFYSTFLQSSDVIGSMDSLMEAKKAVKNERSLAAISRLEELYKVLTMYGVEEYVSFDLGMLSKYHYYTGIIFKVYTYGVGAPIIKGGRYDNLLLQFGKDAAAVGFATVIDDILEAKVRQKIAIQEPDQVEKVYYNSDNFADKLAVVTEMRKKGIAVSLLPEDK